MQILQQINPGILITIAIGCVGSLRRVFPKNRKIQDELKMILFFIPILLLCYRLLLYKSTPLYPFILRIDWFDSLLFGTLDAGSVIMSIAILFIMFAMFRDYSQMPFLLCARYIAHIGFAIGAIFANDAIARLFYIELVAIISIATVIGDRNIPKKQSLDYSVLHVLSGMLLLVGLLAAIGGGNLYSAEADILHIMSIICICIGLSIPLGVPPFSFAFVDIYGSTQGRNLPLLPSILSKLVLYMCIPLITYLPVEVMFSFGIVTGFYVLIRLPFEKSLVKTILLALLSQVAGVLCFLTLHNDNTGMILSIYLAISMVYAFYFMAGIRLLLKFAPDLAKNITLLHVLRKNKKGMVIKLLLLTFVVLLISLPGCTLYSIKNIMKENVLTLPFLYYIIYIIQMFSIFAGLKILFAYLGLWSNVSESSNIVVKNIKVTNRIKLFLGSGLLLCGGDPLLSYVMPNVLPNWPSHYSIVSLVRYDMVLVLTGLGYYCMHKVLVPKISLFLPNKNIMHLATELMMSVYKMLTEIFEVISKQLCIALDFATKLIKFGLRKSAIGVFSSLYSTEILLCFVLLLLSGMMLFCI